jgi:hypothetical protein
MHADPGAVSTVNYHTLANYITGIGLHYDKFSLFAGIKTPGDVKQLDRKGKTKFSQFRVAVTGIKLRIEASARFYKGFYDNNSSLYIPDFTDSTEYYQDAGMRNNSLKLKAFYFLNRKKRFSYGAAYINNIRQIKSAGSFIINANLYHYKLQGTSSVIPHYISGYYHPWDTFDKFTVAATSAGIGYTHTFAIFKRVFINLLVTLGAEMRHLEISGGNKSLEIWETELGAYDVRSSLGYNSKHLFISFQSIIDGNSYLMPDLDINNQFVDALVIIGYRFGIKKPGFYPR